MKTYFMLPESVDGFRVRYQEGKEYELRGTFRKGVGFRLYDTPQDAVLSYNGEDFVLDDAKILRVVHHGESIQEEDGIWSNKIEVLHIWGVEDLPRWSPTPRKFVKYGTRYTFLDKVYDKLFKADGDDAYYLIEDSTEKYWYHPVFKKILHKTNVDNRVTKYTYDEQGREVLCTVESFQTPVFVLHMLQRDKKPFIRTRSFHVDTEGLEVETVSEAGMVGIHKRNRHGLVVYEGLFGNTPEHETSEYFTEYDSHGNLVRMIKQTKPLPSSRPLGYYDTETDLWELDENWFFYADVICKMGYDIGNNLLYSRLFLMRTEDGEDIYEEEIFRYDVHDNVTYHRIERAGIEYTFQNFYYDGTDKLSCAIRDSKDGIREWTEYDTDGNVVRYVHFIKGEDGERDEYLSSYDIIIKDV